MTKKQWLFWSIIEFCVMAAIAAFVLPEMDFGSNPVLAYVMAALFWCFLILGIIFLLIAINKDKMKNGNKGFSAFKFFRNPLAAVADIAMIAGILGVAAVIFYFRLTQAVIQEILIFLALAGFSLHFVFNSNTFKDYVLCPQNSRYRSRRR